MDILKVNGGRRLRGCISIGGAKNAVLPIMAASLMADGDVILKNVPDLTDVESMCRILRELRVKVRRENDILIINAENAVYCDISEHLMKTMRASNLIWGPLLNRFSCARIPMPGGCRIGSRPMDIHIRGMRAFGVKVEEHGGVVYSEGSARKGADLCLDFPSVGATENLVMAAVTAEGKTVIRNAAREPEVSDLCRFLTACGGRIGGIGSDTLEIDGVKGLHGTEYRIIPDRIVGGTALLAAAMVGGDVTVEGICADHLEAVAAKLKETGIETERGECSLRVRSDGKYGAADLSTMPYPGFPTDIQPQYMAMMTKAKGASMIRESIFENRFTQCAELRKMGADIAVDGRCALVRGKTRLEGASVEAFDLRCGAALILAAMAAEGETTVRGVSYIDRGYCNIEDTFSALGADIVRRNIGE